MKYFEECKCVEDLKELYRALALANHPDRGGDLEAMKDINAQFDAAHVLLKDIHRSIYKSKDATKDAPPEYYTAKQAAAETGPEFRAIINALLGLDGCAVELTGGATKSLRGTTTSRKTPRKAAKTTAWMTYAACTDQRRLPKMKKRGASRNGLVRDVLHDIPGCTILKCMGLSDRRRTCRKQNGTQEGKRMKTTNETITAKEYADKIEGYADMFVQGFITLEEFGEMSAKYYRPLLRGLIAMKAATDTMPATEPPAQAAPKARHIKATDLAAQMGINVVHMG